MCLAGDRQQRPFFERLVRRRACAPAWTRKMLPSAARSAPPSAARLGSSSASPIFAWRASRDKLSLLPRRRRAPLAQLAEQLTLNQRVPGSSPGGCTVQARDYANLGPFSFVGVLQNHDQLMTVAPSGSRRSVAFLVLLARRRSIRTIPYEGHGRLRLPTSPRRGCGTVTNSSLLS